MRYAESSLNMQRPEYLGVKGHRSSKSNKNVIELRNLTEHRIYILDVKIMLKLGIEFQITESL